jgi:hypothetical protein
MGEGPAAVRVSEGSRAPALSSCKQRGEDLEEITFQMAAQGLVLSHLPDLVKEKFNAAKEAQELTFWPTQVSILHLKGVPVRHSPSLPLSYS